MYTSVEGAVAPTYCCISYFNLFTLVQGWRLSRDKDVFGKTIGIIKGNLEIEQVVQDDEFALKLLMFLKAEVIYKYRVAF